MPVHRGDRRGRAAELPRQAGRRLAAAARAAHARGGLLGEIAFLDRAIALLGTGGSDGAELLPDLVSVLLEARRPGRAERLADKRL